MRWLVSRLDFRGTQWICSSKYLFLRQIFAGWEIWKKYYVLGRKVKVLLGNRQFRVSRDLLSRIAGMCDFCQKPPPTERVNFAPWHTFLRNAIILVMESRSWAVKLQQKNMKAKEATHNSLRNLIDWWQSQPRLMCWVWWHTCAPFFCSHTWREAFHTPRRSEIW